LSNPSPLLAAKVDPTLPGTFITSAAILLLLRLPLTLADRLIALALVSLLLLISIRVRPRLRLFGFALFALALVSLLLLISIRVRLRLRLFRFALFALTLICLPLAPIRRRLRLFGLALPRLLTLARRLLLVAIFVRFWLSPFALFALALIPRLAFAALSTSLRALVLGYAALLLASSRHFLSRCEHEAA
jgi:hypothetical protein